jgi:hypothetical protein
MGILARRRAAILKQIPSIRLPKASYDAEAGCYAKA